MFKSDCFDVVVAGAGTAGVIAALQSAGANCRTLLVERSGIPGGTMTSAMVCYPGLFFAWKKQIIAGIGWDLVKECAGLSGTELPRFEEQIGMQDHPRYQVQLNPACYSLLCDEKMTAAGVERSYHTMIAGAVFTDNIWKVTLCTINGLKEVRARVLIDCTGDAALTAAAGLKRIIPENVQPGTLCCKLSGYDLSGLDQDALASAAEQAVRDGSLKWTDISWNINGFGDAMLSKHGDNANHIFPETSPADALQKSEMEIEGRAALLRAYRFFRRQKGLEDLTIDRMAPETGIRESAVISGVHKITLEEYISGTHFPDSLCYAFYPVDLHEKSALGVQPKHLQPGKVPSVPLRALIPENSCSFLAAGRCISSDRRANSALRVQATAMATGQAAGAAAALAVRNNCTPLQLDVQEIKQLLKQHGAITP